MTSGRTIIAAGALLALTACGRSDNTAQTNAVTTTTGTTETEGANVASVPAAPSVSASQGFANAAAASDTFEIETSKLALANGASTAVKAYARKMIDAHMASTAKLKAAATSASPALTPNPALNVEQQGKLDQLKGLSGAAFDRAYVAEQAVAHQQTLDVLKAYSATGDVPALKTFATGLVPTVAAHLNMVKSMKV